MATKRFKSFGNLPLASHEFLRHLESLDPSVKVTVTPWDSHSPHQRALGVHYIEARRLVEWFEPTEHRRYINKISMRAGPTHHCVYEVDFWKEHGGAAWVMFNVVNEQLSMEYRARS